MIFLTGLLFACASFFYVPQEDMDLAAYYRIFDSGKSIAEYYMNHSGEVIKADYFVLVLFNILSAFGFSSHSIAFAAAFIYFSSLACIAYNWRKWVPQRQIGILFIFLILSEYLMGFTGIRYDNGVLMFILSFQYFELNKKRKAILFSILAVFFHFSLFPIVAIFWLSQYISLKACKWIAVAFIVSVFFFMPLMKMMQQFVMGMGPIGIAVGKAMDSYIFTDDGGVLWAGSRFWPLQRLFAFVIVNITMFILYLKKVKFSEWRISIDKFVLLFSSYLIWVFSSRQIFMRSLLVYAFLFVLLEFYIFHNKRMGTVRRLAFYSLGIFFLLGMTASFSGKEFMILLGNPSFVVFSPLGLLTDYILG